MNDAIHYYSDTIDPVVRSSPTDVFLVTIEAKPKPDTDEAKEYAGAFCSCWVNADDLRSAERRTVDVMDEQNWIPFRFDEWHLVGPDFYRDWKPREENDVDCRNFPKQALIDGEVFVAYTFPLDAPDAEETD